MQVQWASRDRQGLQDAIWTWLTRPAAASRDKRRGRSGRIAYAFELWIGHLILLERALELAPAEWPRIQAVELAGLNLLRAARERYSREYRPCQECGEAMRGKICPRCGALAETGTARTT